VSAPRRPSRAYRVHQSSIPSEDRTPAEQAQVAAYAPKGTEGAFPNGDRGAFPAGDRGGLAHRGPRGPCPPGTEG
jgi:hypothetical protein